MFPERARDEDTKDEQDRIELEYLEKLLERAKAKQNQYSGFALEDEEMDQMNPNEFEDQIRHFNTELFLQDAPRQNAGRIFRRLVYLTFASGYLGEKMRFLLIAPKSEACSNDVFLN